MMLRLLLNISIIAVLVGCNSNTNSSNMKNEKNQPEKAIDTIPKVTGIGGIFFYSDDPEEAKDWYSKNLGIEINDWGSASFESRNIDNPDEINSLQWKPFKTG